MHVPTRSEGQSHRYGMVRYARQPGGESHAGVAFPRRSIRGRFSRDHGLSAAYAGRTGGVSAKAPACPIRFDVMTRKNHAENEGEGTCRNPVPHAKPADPINGLVPRKPRKRKREENVQWVVVRYMAGVSDASSRDNGGDQRRTKSGPHRENLM